MRRNDDTALALARVRPKSIRDLSTFRGLAKGEIHHSGENLLKAFRQAENNPRNWSPPSDDCIPNPEQERALDLLKTYVNLLAFRHKLPPRFLIKPDHLAPLLLGGELNVSDWVSRGLVHEKAAALVGEDLVEFLNGKRSLTLDQGRVTVLGRS